MDERKALAAMLSIAVALLTAVSISTPVVAGDLTYVCDSPSTECDVIVFQLYEEDFDEPYEADLWLWDNYQMIWGCEWGVHNCMLFLF